MSVDITAGDIVIDPELLVELLNEVKDQISRQGPFKDDKDLLKEMKACHDLDLQAQDKLNDAYPAYLGARRLAALCLIYMANGR